jgi:predicted enzyme related to lactoylglutathione lyase
MQALQLVAKNLILFVEDVQRVAQFYEQVLGLEVLEASSDKKWVKLRAGDFSIGVHSGGRPNKWRRAPKLVFYSANVSKTRSDLQKRGAKMGVVKSSATLAFCDGKDPEGNPFQISNRS